jgi:hypothetical protein
MVGLLLAAVGLACGRTELDGFAAIDAGVAMNAKVDGGDAPAVSAICASAHWPDPAVIALVALANDQLVLTRADGTVLTPPIPNPQGFWRQGDLLLAAGMTGSRLDAMVVDRLGVERWRISRSLGGDARLGEDVYLDAGGAAALRIDGLASLAGVAVMPGGDAHDLPEIPRSAPDPDGWIVAAFSDDQHPLGFMNAITGETRPSRFPVARPGFAGYFSGYLVGGRLTYLGLDGDHTALIVEGPDGADRYALPAAFDVTTGEVVSSDAGPVVTENGRPRWLLRGAPPALVAVGALAGDDGANGLFWNAPGEMRGLVTVGNVPRWSVQLETGAVVLIAPPPPPVSTAPVTLRIVDGWALGTFDDGSWFADLVTGDSGPLDLSALAPLRPLGTLFCAGPPNVFEGRLLAIGLRDRQQAGLYLGQLGQLPWTRIGDPSSGVERVNGFRVADTWVVRAIANDSDFCPFVGYDPPAAGEHPIPGDSVQVILAGAAAPAVFAGHQLADLSFHTSGLCAVVGGAVHDFVSGSTYALPPSTSVTWWDQGQLQ